MALAPFALEALELAFAFAVAITAVAVTNELTSIPSAYDVMLNEEEKEKAKNRPSNVKNPHDAYDSITKAQDAQAKGRPEIDNEDDEWDGANSRPEQNAIRSTEKSRQRDRHTLDRLQLDDLNDMDDMGEYGDSDGGGSAEPNDTSTSDIKE